VPAGLSPSYLAVVAAYVATLTLAYAALVLPLAYYSGYVLPHRYELSVQSRPGWAADYVKGLLVGLVQAVIVAVAVYALLAVSPQWWWLWAGVVLALFGVVLANLAPVLILPLFYKLTPLASGPLRDRLLYLAAAAGVRVPPGPGVYLMDMSRRTRAANAGLVGLGATRRIVLGDTMVEGDRYSPAEIGSVLAHELGHHAHNDLWRAIAVDAALTFGVLWLADQALALWSEPLGLAGKADVAGLPLLLLATGGAFVALLPLTSWYSRRREAAADRFAMQVTGDVEAWKGALRKLADQNLAEVDPPAWVEWLLYSHPSIRHRLEAADRAGRALSG
jgi:STE24 endopeptidase